VREALARLESEGMIVVEGRGFVVPELTDADIEEIYQLRFLLEPAAASSAVAEVGSPTDLASMSRPSMMPSPPRKCGDFRAFLEANSRFHNAWRALVPNRRMSKLLDQYVGHVRFLRVLTLGDAGARKAALTGMKASTPPSASAMPKPPPPPCTSTSKPQSITWSRPSTRSKRKRPPRAARPWLPRPDTESCDAARAA
jgi:hypothetical protein